MNKVNYLGMRRILENSGNQQELDRLILNFLNSEDVEKESSSPVLCGVTLQESTIGKLSTNMAKILLLNGAKPTRVFIERLIGNCKYDDLFFLYEHGYISIEEFQKEIFELCGNDDLYSFFGMCKKVIMDTEKFVGFDFRKLEKIFSIRINFVAETGFIWEKILRICFQFIRILPTEDHLATINTVFQCIRDKQSDLGTKLKFCLEKQMQDFMQEEVFSKLSGNDLIEALNIPKYKTILLSNPLIAVRSLFQESGDNAYDTVVNELFELICDGKIDRISVTFRYFPELFERRNEILNVWIDRDRALEVDVYGNAFIEAKTHTIEEKIDSNLDEKYMAAKNNEQGLEDKKINFKPVGSQNAQN